MIKVVYLLWRCTVVKWFPHERLEYFDYTTEVGSSVTLTTPALTHQIECQLGTLWGRGQSETSLKHTHDLNNCKKKSEPQSWKNYLQDANNFGYNKMVGLKTNSASVMHFKKISRNTWIQRTSEMKFFIIILLCIK